MGAPDMSERPLGGEEGRQWGVEGRAIGAVEELPLHSRDSE